MARRCPEALSRLLKMFLRRAVDEGTLPMMGEGKETVVPNFKRDGRELKLRIRSLAGVVCLLPGSMIRVLVSDWMMKGV